MSNNHLIIGLGGTGGKTIKNLRKAIYEEFRSNNPNESPFAPKVPVHIKYLYVDSSKPDLSASEQWRTHGDIGSHIGLNNNSQLKISENNLAQRLNDAQHYPVTHRYIGKKEDWNEIFGAANVNEMAGGQMRRLGVALFEPECTKFVDHVGEIVRQFTKDNNVAGTKFHVCGGLAGGTGSGTFLHVVAQLRSKFTNAELYPIYLYLLLPEENSPWAANGENTNYYANGYAALLELNAYQVRDDRNTPNKGGGLFTPIDLTGQTQRFENVARNEPALKADDRLQGSFILDNVNGANRTIPMQQITQLFAQLLYQRIFMLSNLPDDTEGVRDLRDALSIENMALPPEPTPKVGLNLLPLRSRRFQTFGVKKILIPDEEIREYLSACFAEQSILQMLYNHWLGGDTCYRSEPINQPFADFVKKEVNRRPWKLTNPQITLSEGLLEAETRANWDDIDQEWMKAANKIKNVAWTIPVQEGRDNRLDSLESEFQSHYDRNFRENGVVAFYDAKKADLGRENTHIAEVCGAVHAWMFQKWRDGDYGFIDLQSMLSILIDDTIDRKSKIAKRLRDIETSRNKLSDLITKNKVAWGNVGVLGRWAGKREALFDAQAECLKEYYELQTWNVAWRFADLLLQRCLTDLQENMQVTFTNFKIAIEGAQEFFIKRRITTCCPENNDNLLLIKYYDPDQIRNFCRGLLTSESKQKQWAQRSRSEFVNAAETNRIDMGIKDKNFGALLQYGGLKNMLEQVAREHSQQAHDDATNRNNRLIGANIVSRLAAQYQNNEDGLREYFKEIVASTQTFMRFNQAETPDDIMAVTAVILPVCDEAADFRARLSNLFSGNQIPGSRFVIVNSNRNLNQISLISFKYAFPLRSLKPVQFLKGKYDLRLHLNPARARLEVHIEDHPTDRLPDLFRPQPDQMGTRILPLYQLSMALDLLQARHNPANNKQDWQLETLDADGLPEHHFYPNEVLSLLVEMPEISVLSVAELQDVINSTTEEQIVYLEKAVNPIIMSESYQMATHRENLKIKLREQLAVALKNRRGNVGDAFYIKLHESTKNAFALIDRPA